MIHCWTRGVVIIIISSSSVITGNISVNGSVTTTQDVDDVAAHDACWLCGQRTDAQLLTVATVCCSGGIASSSV